MQNINPELGGQPAADINKATEEDTSTNEIETTTADPAITDNTGGSDDELSHKIKEQEEKSRELGYVSKTSTDFLIKQAKAGNEEAKQAILDNDRINQYARKTFGSEYSEIFSGSVDADDVYQKVKAGLKKDQQEETLKKLMGDYGVKGEDTVEAMKRTVNALIETGDDVETAFKTAYYRVKGEKPSTVPHARGGVSDVVESEPSAEEINATIKKYPQLNEAKARQLIKNSQQFMKTGSVRLA